MQKKTICTLLFMSFLVSCNNEPDLPAYNNVLFIYPNPVQLEATITIQNPEGGPYKLLVFDTHGDLMLEENANESRADYKIFLEDKPEGIYQVVLKIAGKDYSQNFIKTE